MYIVTNRALVKGSGLKAFAETPNPKGPNELRIVDVNKKGRSWHVKELKDKLKVEDVKVLKKKHGLKISLKDQWHGSLTMACHIFDQAQREQKSILFFIHGYNNDIEDVIKAAHEIEQLYKVICIPFTWPANGGGVISGTASYLSDKADARASSGAINRFVEKVQFFHGLFNEATKNKILATVEKTYAGKNNPQAAATLYTRLMEKKCKTKLSLLCHSMGNYVLKHSLMTSENSTSKLVFDNICLVAADTNSEQHASWVGKLDVRSRLYVVINENDSALKVSRIKPGDEQKARLGHYLKQLNSPNAYYVDITDENHVDSEHTYFKGDSVNKNPALHSIFDDMFNGRTAERLLDYRVDNNSYIFST